MNLERLKNIMADNGCTKVFVKPLAPNDNSKNQVYLGGSDIFNLFPMSDITAESPGEWKRERFKATSDFAWIGEEGQLFKAPNAQFILYPKYPEVRFSGFLSKCVNAPSDLMTIRQAGRLLFLSVSNTGQILGFVTAPDSVLAREFLNVPSRQEGVFRTFELMKRDSKVILMKELSRIYQLGWIPSKRLDKYGAVLDCNAPNCGGYTLEAELGITPNGYSEPDFLGWEVKQFGVTNLKKPGNAVITLMTPEPTEGLYVSEGVEYFIRNYGYPDQNGREDRLNFGGVHKASIKHPRTSLTLELIGFDADAGKIKSAGGKIALVDEQGNEAAAWSFAALLQHWNRKHNQACYVPSKSETDPLRRYCYGNLVTLGVETDFQLFLAQMHLGNIYYDPGIKMENISVKPVVKRRSQFRMSSQYLGSLYKRNETVDVLGY
ncbi:MvaI/BcnI family restriction endonuclease [Runella slithyformis]|uniref:MvaI/BcnI restriction endonuclease domain-containing protein n=1 Tax=Runella slithyformis (strain ATCC 29530 / DSM 19594 / LMG 11500 / NCIMB 11436 / LSU 4) TaxID=761193 RepID=A0A7U3ZRQ6_RUNSL|nr:MvaI/BcnI family restriction endonuclease [Runella slithyformis]AEI52150.1 hypothetical protein Runsl_5853 [Runella slithyformis DSM 19594]